MDGVVPLWHCFKEPSECVLTEHIVGTYLLSKITLEDMSLFSYFLSQKHNCPIAKTAPYDISGVYCHGNSLN